MEKIKGTNNDKLKQLKKKAKISQFNVNSYGKNQGLFWEFWNEAKLTLKDQSLSVQPAYNAEPKE